MEPLASGADPLTGGSGKCLNIGLVVVSNLSPYVLVQTAENQIAHDSSTLLDSPSRIV